MTPREGLRVTLIEQCELDQAGVLTSNSGCTEAYGLPDGAVRLFLLIAGAGEEGLAQSKVPKDLRADLNTHLLPLELQELVAWERDNRGRLAYLVLTWKGKEALDAARPKPKPKNTLAAQRRAAIRAGSNF